MTRGRWEGSGTFETASGPGAGFVLAAVAVVAVLAALEWLVARLWWLIGGSVLLIAAALAVLHLLIRAQERREARHAAGRPFAITRGAAASPAAQPSQVAAPEPRVIVNNYGPQVHVHGHDGDSAGAAWIGHALPGRAGDATEEE